MNTLVIVLIAAVCLFGAYVLYGRWLANKWGIDPAAKTPAVVHEDGRDYVPTNGWTVFAHQFSSIAGAGPVTGAIQAAAFGWLPVLLWVSIDLRPTVNGPWYRLEPGGEPFMWISNEHCVVLAGYDREHYICCDPWKDRGMAAWPRETVWQRHRELGMQAVALEGPV